MMIIVEAKPTICVVIYAKIAPLFAFSAGSKDSIWPVYMEL